MSVTFDGWHGPQNLGIMMADARGYLADEGLKITTYTPTLLWKPIPYIGKREVDVSISHLPEVVLAKERGAPIVVLGSLIAQPTASMIWLKRSQLHGLADLRGKTIGVPGLTFQRVFLERVLARAGLSPSEVRIKVLAYDLLPALIHGKVDAIFGGSANIEGAKLSVLGLKPVIIPVERLGIPPFDELVVIARQGAVARDPELYRRLMAAFAKGTAVARKTPKDAPGVIRRTGEDEPSNSPAVVKAQLEATAPLLSQGGHVNPRQARALIAWMKAQGMIKKAFSFQVLRAPAG